MQTHHRVWSVSLMTTSLVISSLFPFAFLVSLLLVRCFIIKSAVVSFSTHTPGASTALLGKECAMACTVAVEESISEHYNSQIRALMEKDPERYIELLQVSLPCATPSPLCLQRSFMGDSLQHATKQTVMRFILKDHKGVP